ncbi:Phosphatidylinositide phosphatase SAC1 [Podochytrium sp. JEL0797]|nr:Phosphatidylinositide phosphatase SAC1 [Podochytrium sp. JEL0797]
MLHDALSLYSTATALTLEPVFSNALVPRHSLVFPRKSQTNAKVQIRIDSPPAPTLQQETQQTVYGVVGIVALNAGPHLILITNRQKVTRLLNSDLYRLTAHTVIPIHVNTSLSLTPAQIRDDELYLQMLDSLLGNGFWYFSYQTDVTRNVQRLAEWKVEGSKVWEQADDRFFWNKSLLSPLIDLAIAHPETNISAFILPLTCGFMEFKNLPYNHKRVTLGLISRRSKFRAGTRYNTRGVDADGNVANNVETEQVLVFDQPGGGGIKCASYVQTRGSIPLYWGQLINIKYQPKMVIEEGNVSFQAYKKHFTNQIAYYGPQIAVNLINTKGYEARLNETWMRMHTQLNNPAVRYLHFDFHHECKKMRWDRIGKLVGDIEGDLVVQGYCVVEGVTDGAAVDVKRVKTQTSVVRTNCMDCLDRTNVVQSVLGRRVLPQQLVEFCGGLGVVEEEFEHGFKNLWADHADAISLVYSGTGALKTDFTRTGKRSVQGVLQDGANSVVRYVKNNFFDGFRQDSFDLFLGNYEVNPLASSPFDAVQKPLQYYLLPAALLVSFIMVILTLLMFHYSSSYFFMSLAFWCSLGIAAYRAVIFFGPDFVDRPHLVKGPNVLAPEFKISEKPDTIFSHKAEMELPKNNPEVLALCTSLAATGNTAPDPTRVEAPAETRSRKCNHCGAAPTGSTQLKQCQNCRLAFYCGRECQKGHWRAGHRTDCNWPWSVTATPRVLNCTWVAKSSVG